MTPVTLARTCLAHARSPLGQKALRYASVSVVGVVLTQVLIILFHGVLDVSATWSNVLAVAGSAGPCYLLNRRWVWGKSGKHRFGREVVPFWGMALLGLLLSTALVALAYRWWDSTLAVSAANLAGFGVLWVARFLLLDKLVFRHEHVIEELPEVQAAA